LHLIDVKNFLIPIKSLFFIFLFLTLLLFPFYQIKKRFLFILTFLFLFFFFLIIFNFDFSFILFHKIFFKQNYEFPTTYNLIQLYPEKFFILSFTLSSLFSLLLLILFLLFYP